jgi:hypothetical protein
MNINQSKHTIANSPLGDKGIYPNKILSYIILLYILFLLPTLAIAQDGFGDEIGDVPVDGGLSLLVAAGLGYGAKKLRENRKKEK